MPNVYVHHVHCFLKYNHLHNGNMTSTNNNIWSTSVDILKNYLLFFLIHAKSGITYILVIHEHRILKDKFIVRIETRLKEGHTCWKALLSR